MQEFNDFLSQKNNFLMEILPFEVSASLLSQSNPTSNSDEN
jgi:hypothetical protein